MTIPVHPVFGPLPVTPCPVTPATEREIKAEWQRQASIALAKIKLNPAPVEKIRTTWAQAIVAKLPPEF